MPEPNSNVKERRPQWLADGKIRGIFRRENSMRTQKIVTLRKNKNSGGAKILFFAKSRFRMFSGDPKNDATGASAIR